MVSATESEIAMVAAVIFSAATSPEVMAQGGTVNGVRGEGQTLATATAAAPRSVLTTSAAPMTARPGDGVALPVVVEAVRREAVPAPVAVGPVVGVSAAGAVNVARMGERAALKGANVGLKGDPAAPMVSIAAPARGVSRIDSIASRSVSRARGVLLIDAPPVMSDPWRATASACQNAMTALTVRKPRRRAKPLPPPPPDDLIWGRHASQAALESGRPIHRIWCTSEMRSASKFLQLLRDAKASGVLVEEVTWARLGQITGGSVHQGIALQTAAAETLDLDGLIQGCSELGEPPLLLALDGVTDPHNLGAVVRSAEAMGAHGVVLPQRRSAGLTGSVAKVAAGALEHMPVARVVNLNRSLEKLKDAGYRVIGLAAEGDVTLPDVDLEGPLVLVTGSEDQGLSLLTRRHCDQLVRIPLRGITPSLNASVATALCVYEIARRGWMKDIHGQAPSPPISRPRTQTESASDAADQDSEVAVVSVPREEIDLSMTVDSSQDAPVHFDESVQLSS